MYYSIGQLSGLTGLGVHTLHYYEQEGLIIPERNTSNHRRYSDKDIEWINFIKCLKDTGISNKEITRYAQLRTDGDLTFQQRLEILMQHRQVLNEQIVLLQKYQAKLDEKVNFYKEDIEKQKAPCNQ